MDSAVVSSVVVPLSLFLMMFTMGLSLSMDDFRRVVVMPRAVLVGSFAQIAALPVIGFACAQAFGLSGELAVGMVIAAACAGGATSNMLAFLARADVALSVTLTAISSCVTIFTIPVVVNLALSHFMGDGSDIHLPVLDTIVSLLTVTIFPVAVGVYISHRFPGIALRVEPVFQNLSILVLLLIVAGAFATGGQTAKTYVTTIGPASCLINIACMAVGYFLARVFRLSKEQSSSIVIEVGVQNVATAFFIAGTLLHNPLMAIPAAVYSLPMFLNAGIVVALFRRG